MYFTFGLDRLYKTRKKYRCVPNVIHIALVQILKYLVFYCWSRTSLYTAARLISRKRKHEHITPLLVSLHWLPVQYRIKYKILLYTFKALNNLAPVYLQELVNAYQPTRALRSEDLQLLKAPRIRNKTYGERRLDKSAATLWNSLPQNIRHVQSVSIFKKLLKTHLFRAAYGDSI